MTASMQDGESSVSDHTGLHPICIISELEQLFSLIAKNICVMLMYIVSTEWLFVLSKCRPFSVTFIMTLVCLHRARSGVYFGSTSCEDGILQ